MALSSTAIAVIVVTVAIAAASTAYSLYQQSEQTAAANRYQDRLATERDREIEENYALAIKSANEQYRATQARMAQEGAATGQKEFEGAVKAAQARSTALTAAGEAGVGGLSVGALLNDFRAQEAQYRDSLRTNLGFARDQLESEMQGINAQAAGRVAAIKPYMKQPVEEPNYIGGVLRVGGAALGAYSQYTSGLSTDSSSSGYNSGAGYQAYRAGERRAY